MEPGSCPPGCTDAEHALNESEELLLQQSMLSEEEEGPARTGCVSPIHDFTEPARHPDWRSGAIPGALSLPLFTDLTLTAKVLYWTWNYEGSVSWIGLVQDDPGGTAIITVVDGWYTATVRAGSKTWIVRPDPTCVGLGEHRVEEFDEVSEEDLCSTGADAEPSSTSMSIQPTVGAPQIEALTAEDNCPADTVCDYGEMSEHPTQALPTIDIMFVASEAAIDRWGGIPGFIGFANNRVHEADIAFLRTSRERTHRVRMVSMRVDSTSDDFVLLNGKKCHDANRNVVEASVVVQDERDAVGGDVVAIVTTPEADCTAGTGGLGESETNFIWWEPGLATHDNYGTFNVITGSSADASWSFSHELGHVLGMGHHNEADAPPQQRRFAGARFAAQHQGAGPLHEYKTMMASGDAPGCRVPVFERLPTYGWRPDSTTTPCEERHGLEIDFMNLYGLTSFGAQYFDEAVFWGQLNGFGQENGLRLGLEDDGIGNVIQRCGGDALFEPADADPWTETYTPYESWTPICGVDAGTHSLAETVAFYKPATTTPFEDALVGITGASPGSLGRITAPVITLTFDLSRYSKNLHNTSVPSTPDSADTGDTDIDTASLPPTVCYDPESEDCDYDLNPYFLDIKTSWGATTFVVAQWITLDACRDPNTGALLDACQVIPSTGTVVTGGSDGTPFEFDPNAVYYVRLWTQVTSQQWGYVEARLNTDIGSDAVGLPCNADNPELAPPSAVDFGCPASVDAVLASSSLLQADEPGAPNRRVLQIDLDATNAAAAGRRAGVDTWNATEPRTPYDLTAYGSSASGIGFCCHYTIPDGEPFGVEVRGTNHDDIIDLGSAGAITLLESDPARGEILHIGVDARGGSDLVVARTGPEVRSYLHGGGGTDGIVGSGWPSGFVKGEGAVDWLAVQVEPRPVSGSLPTLTLDGGGAGDTLITARSQPGDEPLGVDVRMIGTAGNNTLCSEDGTVRMTGSQPAYPGSDLYLSGTWAPDDPTEPYTINSCTSAFAATNTPCVKASSALQERCGALVHYTRQGSWAGPGCIYQTIPPTTPPVPPTCEGWVDP